MKNFTFRQPTEIFFGKDSIDALPAAIKKISKRVLLTYGGGSIRQNGVYARVVKLLKEHDFFFKELSGIAPNPRLSSVEAGVALCREHNLDFILAVGGGSVIDCSKAIAAGVLYDGDSWDFCVREATVEKALPIGAVLTLSATGSEMNGGAVITNEATRQKRPMFSDLLIPRFSILDPTYTFSVPAYHSAAGCVDIFSHVLEQYFTPVNEAYIQRKMAEGLLRTCIKYGPVVLEDPENYEARSNLMWASSLALNGLLSAGAGGDWATHMIEHEISALSDLTHGAGLAILTPHWMEYVCEKFSADRFARFAENVWRLDHGNEANKARLGIERTRLFFSSLGMPEKLGDVGVDKEWLPLIAQKAVAFGPLGQFYKLGEADILSILEMAF